MVFPADLRNANSLNAVAQNIEGVINVALRENLADETFPPPSITLSLVREGEFIELTVAAKPYQFLINQLEE